MQVRIGLTIVFASILYGYATHHGQIDVLPQWAEFIIIGGAAIGAFIVANTGPVIKGTFARLMQLLKPNAYKPIVCSELLTMQYEIIIEGHTDGVPLERAGGYSNWELSSDRANATGRALQSQGVAPNRVASVRGFADRFLKIRDFPSDPRNRRISILLPFRNTEVSSVKAASTASATDSSRTTI